MVRIVPTSRCAAGWYHDPSAIAPPKRGCNIGVTAETQPPPPVSKNQSSKPGGAGGGCPRRLNSTSSLEWERDMWGETKPVRTRWEARIWGTGSARRCVHASRDEALGLLLG